MVTSEQLRDKLAAELLSRLDNGEPGRDGEPAPAGAATLAVILNFLKQFPPSEPIVAAGSSPQLDALASRLKPVRPLRLVSKN